MEENSELPPESGYGGTETGETVCFVQDEENPLVNHGAVLDEHIQQLVDSGAVGEDSIIAIVHNEHGEPQTVVLSKQEAEALGIQIEPNEAVIQQVSASGPLEESLEAHNAEAVIDELKAAITQPGSEEFENATSSEIMEPPPEDISGASLETLMRSEQPEATPLENEESTNIVENKEDVSVAPESSDKKLESEEVTNANEEKPESESTDETNLPDSDVLSSIIQSLFNPNDASAANVSVVPKIIGGKRKLCLRVPTSTASALLAQSGSPFVTSLHEGGVPKKIKIVIPPAAVSSLTSATSLKSSVAKSDAATPQGSNSKGAKPFLQSLFTASSGSSTATTPTSSKAGSTPKAPIQLVQEGTTFRSLQPLTSEQLKHIANVLKQDRESIISGEGSSAEKQSQGTRGVMIDKASNAKVIYRMLNTGGDKTDVSSASPMTRGRGRRGRPPKYLSASASKKPSYSQSESDTGPEEDTGSLSGQELSKEEREDKKRSLQRTRSGRVSKPPKHMMKDYKRLHYLDFAQPDLDDSDGGYSDYQDKGEENSNDGEAEGEEKSKPESPIPPSPFHCTTCKKEYTTPLRLGRHYEQFPSHGSLSVEMRNAVKQPRSDDDGYDAPAPRGRGFGRGAGRGRGRRPRGRPPLSSPSVQAERRRIRLAEALEASRDDDVVDVAGPRLAAAMSSWEYLLLRVQQEDEGNSKDALVPRILKEAATLMNKITSVATEYLSAKKTSQSSQAYELKDAKVAALIGLPCGTYYISKDERRLLRDPLMLDENDDEDSQDANMESIETKEDLQSAASVGDQEQEEKQEMEEAVVVTPAESSLLGNEGDESTPMQVDELTSSATS